MGRVLGQLCADMGAADVTSAMTADTKELHGAVSKLGKARLVRWRCGLFVS